MTRTEAISLIKSAQLMLINPTTNEPVSDLYMALYMAIQALEQMPEVTSTMQTGQFDYVPIRETKGISCSECRYFKVTQQPLRGTGGLIDLGQARCEKHDLIPDFAHKGKFKHLKPCEYFVDFKEGDKK